MTTDGRPQSLGEEIANAVSHGVGLVASVAALPVLVLAAGSRGDARLVAACGIFAASLIVLYAASTLYHAIPHPGAKRALRVVDHTAIYLLIAGSYTPFALGVLRGTWGWWLFGVIWALALTGILFKTTLGFRFPRVSVGFYLLMGWLAVVAARPLYHSLPAAGLGWLVAGGLLYSGGVIFYRWERLRYGHFVWHLFVLGGSACHFWAVLRYALPASA
jgi:hemolysin III